MPSAPGSPGSAPAAPQPPSIRAALLHAMQANKERTFLVCGKQSMTYGRMQVLAFAFLAWLQENHVPPGCSVAFIPVQRTSTGGKEVAQIRRMVAGLALLIGNYIIVEKPTSLTRIVLYDHDVSGADKKLPDTCLHVPGNWLNVASSGLDLPKILRALPRVRQPSAPCLIASSSGTTGTPKRIPITAAQLLIRAQRFIREEPMADEDVIWYNMNGLTNQGLLYLVATVLRGGTLTPRITQAFRHILSPATFLLKHKELSAATLGQQEKMAGTAKPYKEVRVVGSSVSPPLLERLRHLYENICVSYGSTEVGPIASKLVQTAEDLHGVGPVYSDISVQIVDAEMQPLPTGSEGEIRIKTDSTVSGYLANEMLTTKAFQDGWFFPGDLGLITDTGELRITGRLSDMFNIGGVKVNAAEQDALLLSCKYVQDAMVFTEIASHGIPLLSALVVLETNVQPTDAMAIFAAEYKSRHMIFTHIPQKFYVVDSIPRNDNGKPMRQLAESAVINTKPLTFRDLP